MKKLNKFTVPSLFLVLVLAIGGLTYSTLSPALTPEQCVQYTEAAALTADVFMNNGGTPEVKQKMEALLDKATDEQLGGLSKKVWKHILDYTAKVAPKSNGPGDFLTKFAKDHCTEV